MGNNHEPISSYWNLHMLAIKYNSIFFQGINHLADISLLQNGPDQKYCILNFLCKIRPQTINVVTQKSDTKLIFGIGTEKAEFQYSTN